MALQVYHHYRDLGPEAKGAAVGDHPLATGHQPPVISDAVAAISP